MGRDLTLKNFLKDLGVRVGAAIIVVGVFFGLGYVKRMDLFGLARFLGDQRVFIVVGLLLVGVVSLGWIAVQQYRG